MNTRDRRWIVAALHLAIVASLGAKLLYDRETRPRVWVRAAPFDPDALFRGRYVRMQIEVRGPDGALDRMNDVELRVEGDQLVARPADHATHLAATRGRGSDAASWRMGPLAYFIAEHDADPSIRPAGEELWVEVTVPRRGLPRPIRLGVRKDGQITPLESISAGHPELPR